MAILGKRKVRLYLTGPEMSGKDGEFKRKKPGAEEGQQQGEDVRNDKRLVFYFIHISGC